MDSSSFWLDLGPSASTAADDEIGLHGFTCPSRRAWPRLLRRRAFGLYRSTSTPPDRVAVLERTVQQLASNLNTLSLDIGRQIAAAMHSIAGGAATPASISTPLGGVPPTAATSIAKSSKGHARVALSTASHPTASSSSGDTTMMEDFPVWDYKSSEPAMAVLGTVYDHHVHTGATQLARELFAVKGVIDYSFLPATEADSDDNEEEVYVSKFSGKGWKKYYPPPRPCFTCGMR